MLAVRILIQRGTAATSLLSARPADVGFGAIVQLHLCDVAFAALHFGPRCDSKTDLLRVRALLPLVSSRLP